MQTFVLVMCSDNFVEITLFPKNQPNKPVGADPLSSVLRRKAWFLSKLTVGGTTAYKAPKNLDKKNGDVKLA